MDSSEARTLGALVDAHARERGDATFVVGPESGETVSFAALRARARALAAQFDDEGVAAGETVSLMLPNGPAAVSAFVGTMAAGRVVAPINLLSQDSQLAYVLAHSRTRLVLAAPEHADRLRALLARERRDAKVVPLDPAQPWPARDGVLPDRDPGAPALLMYTSGTTGRPKGALLSHANLLAAARAVAQHHALTAGDRVLSSLPLYHINGQCIATLSPLVSGGSLVMPVRFSVSQWWPLVERFRPSWLNVVPTIIAYLLNGPEPTATQVDACRRVRFARSASAPLPPEQHRAFEQRFGISVLEAMGLTECASVAFANPLDPAERRIGSPGRPLCVDARVVASDGRVLGAGERGEIELRGPNVMAGYFDAPEATAAALRAGGWLATGDLGYRDDDGFYTITGRLKELIIKGGENIAPREIDEALLAHPAVLEAAAVGVPDDAYGQEIMACVVVKPGHDCDEASLREHCAGELGRYKAPRYFRFVDELPKGPSGKVQRLALQRLFDAR